MKLKRRRSCALQQLMAVEVKVAAAFSWLVPVVEVVVDWAMEGRPPSKVAQAHPILAIRRASQNSGMMVASMVAVKVGDLEVKVVVMAVMVEVVTVGVAAAVGAARVEAEAKSVVPACKHHKECMMDWRIQSGAHGCYHQSESARRSGYTFLAQRAGRAVDLTSSGRSRPIL